MTTIATISQTSVSLWINFNIAKTSPAIAITHASKAKSRNCLTCALLWSLASKTFYVAIIMCF
jgi:hypothetical protein